MIEEIKEKSKMVEEEYKKAADKLDKWEEGKDDGKRLKELKKNLRTLNTQIRIEKNEEKKITLTRSPVRKFVQQSYKK